jgi:L-ribulose-5-phosphate 3-epimerase UlaE
LVRGHRIDNIQGDAKVTADALQFDTNSVALAISIPVLIILLACLFIYYKKKSSSTTYYTYKKLKGENNENEKK